MATTAGGTAGTGPTATPPFTLPNTAFAAIPPGSSARSSPPVAQGPPSGRPARHRAGRARVDQTDPPVVPSRGYTAAMAVASTSGATLELPYARVDLERRVVERADGSRDRLTGTEANLLKYLWARQGSVVSRD